MHGPARACPSCMSSAASSTHARVAAVAVQPRGSQDPDALRWQRQRQRQQPAGSYAALEEDEDEESPPAAGTAAAGTAAAGTAGTDGAAAQSDAGEPYTLVEKLALAGGVLELVWLEGDRMLRVWLPPGERRGAAASQAHGR